MTVSDGLKSWIYGRKLLLCMALGLTGAIIAISAIAQHSLAAGATASDSGTTPENPLRPSGTDDPLTKPAKTAQPEPLPTGEPSANQAAHQPTDPKAAQPTPASLGKIVEAPAADSSAPGKHPLDAALAEAEHIAEYIRKNVKDYTCVVVKQERINGILNPPEYMAAKIRQQPFSVYLKFLRPEAAKGREVIYVAGANEGNLVAREGSGLKRAIGFVLLKPAGLVAMQDNRYPITELGVGNLIDRLLEVGRQDRKYSEAEVHFYKNAKVNGRVCTLIEVIHPVPRSNFRFHKARIYIDDELHVPIRYEAYQWPKQAGDEPPLDEAYTYLDLKLNAGLADADFDYRNPQYHFVEK